MLLHLLYLKPDSIASLMATSVDLAISFASSLRIASPRFNMAIVLARILSFPSPEHEAGYQCRLRHLRHSCHL